MGFRGLSVSVRAGRAEVTVVLGEVIHRTSASGQFCSMQLAGLGPVQGGDPEVRMTAGEDYAAELVGKSSERRPAGRRGTTPDCSR